MQEVNGRLCHSEVESLGWRQDVKAMLKPEPEALRPKLMSYCERMARM